jgi:Fe(3+) dicitrate transport protein
MPSGRLLGLEPFLQKIKSHLILLTSARYHISEYISLMGNVINVLDKEYAVSRVPKTRTSFGINFGIMAEF